MKNKIFVLSIHSNQRSYAFVLFEGEHSPFDWGVRDFEGQSKQPFIVEGVMKLMERYQPRVLVLEDHRVSKAQRAIGLRRLSRALMDAAGLAGVEVRLYSRAHIRECFATVGAKSKPEIAHAIARHIPAFGHRLPPARRTWMSEDRRQSLFDAAALGLTYYCQSARAELRDADPDL